MSELAQLVTRIAGESPPDKLFATLEAAGLTAVGVPENLGGSGGTYAEAAEVVRALAGQPHPAPAAETMLIGGQLLALARLALPSGAGSVAFDWVPDEGLRARPAPNGWHFAGDVGGVPWAERADYLVVLGRGDDGIDVVGVAAAGSYTVRPGGRVSLDADLSDASVVPGGFEAAQRFAALARSVQCAGALDAVLAMTVAYTGQRHQFGRPLARLPAVRQQLAVLAGAVAAADAATVAAVAAPGDTLAVAAAKVQTSISATTAARIAHQLHGAMGVTLEHPLPVLTRRLWAWRDEYGSDSFWSARVSALVAGGNAWAALTG